jgi:hypothetical protein
MRDESPPQPAPVDVCAVCGARLAADQRYCLDCGARTRLVSSPSFEEELAPEIGAAHTPNPASGRRLPSPRTAASLTLLVLGFGIVVGAAASPGGDSLAAGGPPVTVAVAPGAPPAPTRAQPDFDAPAEPATVAEPNDEPAAAMRPAGSNQMRSPDETPAASHPPIKHVFLIVLADHGFYEAFGPQSQAPYLARDLRDQGTLLTRYYAVAHDALANGVALVSGQGPNPDTQANCPRYVNLAPAKIDRQGQERGAGCVYSTGTLTLADQLVANGLEWRAYVQGIAAGAPGTPQACRHPADGGSDAGQAWPGDHYAFWRNPFVFFHTVVDSDECAARDVDLAALETDLKAEDTTPAFSYVVPDLCSDGREAPCAEGRQGGLAAADGFLKEWVPKIMASPAYLDDGLLIITFDQAPASGREPDSRACCHRPEPPNVEDAGGPLAHGPGGGRVGALLLSRYVKPGAPVGVPYDHYSLLRSIEDLFGLEPLGYAGAPGVKPFDQRVYGAWSTS